MTSDVENGPSHGRIIKLLTDLGPYFRRLQSTDSSYFFDCLEICVDDNKEPEEREFLGWWVVVSNNGESCLYERFNGRYNLTGDWVAETISAQNLKQLDNSFALFIESLQTLMEVEMQLQLNAVEAVCSEV
ncbi:sigma factor-binding protein Crl [Psychromonas sp.]|uniref:sigma factor-binding protein Crl n=1 Tax=Psychromonas sp. TaxID=1884585 RepID=UPI003562CBD9